VTYERVHVYQDDQLRDLQPFVFPHPTGGRFLTLGACELAVSARITVFEGLASRRRPDERQR
jgi:hypothetical protein